MLSTFNKLSRMLTQEKRLGYQNKAVMGGLENFAPKWQEEAAQEVVTDSEKEIVGEVVQALQDYPDVSDDDRPTYVHKLLVKLYKAEQRALKRAKSNKSEPDKSKADRPKKETSEKTASKESKAESKPAKPSSQAKAAPQKETQERSSRSRQTSHSQPVPRVKPAAPPEKRVDFTDAGLSAPVTKLPGIKDAYAKKLAKLGVTAISDFLSLYPRRYDDYRNLKPINRLELGEEVTIIAQVWETRKRETHNRRTLVTSTLSDGTATIDVTWFNQPWLANKLRPGLQIVISGKVDAYLGRLTFQSPEWEEIDKELLHTGRIVPVYPLTQGITGKWLRQQVKSTVDYWAPRLNDHLSEEACERLKLLPLYEAFQQIHFPDSREKLEAARRRLAFDELLLIQLGVLRQRQAWRSQQGTPINIEAEMVERLLKALPFQLTGAQRKALDRIIVDLKEAVPMSRLLQGDVGSGKTVVALAAMVLTALDGGQAAILAPTEILAEQHFKGMSKLLDAIGEALDRKLTIGLLTGSTGAAERKELLGQWAEGQIDLLVGTHAIIQGDVEAKNLRLAVIDEQHRFGVSQRAALREKGFNPHMLVMTATPIPRTLALTIYGDLDLSIIDEMPPGRQEIQTRWLTPRQRERAYNFIDSQIQKGRQAFIICPLVEESDKTEARSAIEEHKRLQSEVFPKLTLGLLHGRMKSSEKDQVMTAFRDQEMQVLVSTSVVEVGIDIPNATVILIEGANRFGLAQLHQFRGRVGRGEYKSYCLLLADKVSPEVEARLKAVEETGDGFKLAEKDLELRGPGEFFGTRQSGLPDLKLVRISDTRLLELARSEAELIFKADPALEQPQHQLLVRQLENFWKGESDLS